MSEYVVEEPSNQSASWRVHERIVRCRECAMYEEVSTCGNDFSVCKRFDESYHITEPDGFCAWGERRDA